MIIVCQSFFFLGSVGHYIDVYIGGVKSALQDGNEVYGEADCYIQYHFPQQQVESKLKNTFWHARVDKFM